MKLCISFGLCLVLGFAVAHYDVSLDASLQEDSAACISCLHYLGDVKVNLNTTHVQESVVNLIQRGICNPNLSAKLVEKCEQLAATYAPGFLQSFSAFMAPRWMCWEANLCSWNVTETEQTL